MVASSATGHERRALRALAIGVVAFGAMAFGALAVGAVAIGRLSVGRARVRRLDVGTLEVASLRVAGKPLPELIAASVGALQPLAPSPKSKPGKGRSERRRP